MKRIFIVLLAIAIIGWFGMFAVTNAVKTERGQKIQDMRLQTKDLQIQNVNLKLQNLQKELQKELNSGNSNSQKVKELEQKVQDSNKEIDRLEQENQKLIVKKQLEKDRVAAAQRLALGVNKAYAGDAQSYSWDFLMAQGFTKEQTAGIMGNLQQEHGFQTSDVPGGLGIAQWLGGRRANLMARANYLDLGVQLQFLVDELNGAEIAAGRAVKASTTVEQSTIAFQNLFERCGLCQQQTRINYAYAFYNKH